MQDRVPVNPGRVLIAPENGAAPYYATMTRADNPTQKGTPLNKATLLKDATAALLGLDENAVPDDAISAIKILIDGANANANTKAKIATGSYTGTGTYGSANPNRLTFEFEPKVVFIRSSTVDYTFMLTGTWTGAFSVNAYSLIYGGSVVNSGTMYGRISGNTIEFYATKNARHQFNDAVTYYYIAIV